MDRIIITGATSMIGIALIEQSLEFGTQKIFAVVKPDSTNLNRLPQTNRVVPVECGVETYDLLPILIKEHCDVFFHFAWAGSRNGSSHEQCSDISNTLSALYAAKQLGCKKFIGAGSQGEYGLPDVPQIAPHTPVDPLLPFSIAKYATGKMVLLEAKAIGMHCFWPRIFSVYGKHDRPNSMINSSLRNLLLGKKVAFTAGEQLWDFLYCSDAGRAMYLIGEKATGNKVYCIGSGKACLLSEYIKIIGDTLGASANIEIGKLPYPPNAIMNLCADITSLTSDTGFYPQVDFNNGIAMTVEFIKQKMKKKEQLPNV